MRLMNGASVTDSEVKTISAYFAKRYRSNIPFVLSPEGNRYLKKHL